MAATIRSISDTIIYFTEDLPHSPIKALLQPGTFRRKRVQTEAQIERLESEQSQELATIDRLAKTTHKELSNLYQELAHFKRTHRVLSITMDPAYDDTDACEPHTPLPVYTTHHVVIRNLFELQSVADYLHTTHSTYDYIFLTNHANKNLLQFGHDHLNKDSIEPKTWIHLSQASKHGMIFQACLAGAEGGIVETLAKLPLRTSLLAATTKMTGIGVDRPDDRVLKDELMQTLWHAIAKEASPTEDFSGQVIIGLPEEWEEKYLYRELFEMGLEKAHPTTFDSLFIPTHRQSKENPDDYRWATRTFTPTPTKHTELAKFICTLLALRLTMHSKH
ncbi:MAG: hypothetical protein SP1CHLAM54_01690 [Chlamydiia bacterium]|nr:hypothetical protein [Chlamydiia bacterium]MCH9615087.1 hypothetical protein [Chlamydiia bacterium]MCH9628591.1 hypothetical protein [Chlamydiia bacterium]